jgi:outer membrane protein assembly factor BamB
MQGFRAREISKHVVVWSLAALSARAVDFPQWRGPNRDGALPPLSQKQWPEKLRQVWKITVGEGHSSPVVVGGIVVQFARLGDREVLAAYDLASGKKIWEHAYSTPYTMNSAAQGHGKGPKATPAVGNGKACAIGITGTLTCVDFASGRVAWSQPNLGDALFGTASSPVIDRGLLITQTGKQDNGTITAFGLSDGLKKWSYKSDGPGYSSPVIAEIGGVRQIIVETEHSIVGLNAANGELLWKTPISTPYDQNSVTPLVSGDLVIYSGLSNPVIAIRPVKKGAQWTPEKVWENKEVAMYMNSPVLSGGLLVGMSHRNKGQFFAIDPKSGKTVWTGEGRQAENAAMLASGDTVFALTTNSDLLVMKAGTRGLETLRRYKVSEASETWAHPAVLGDKVLIKDKETLTLWSAQ